MTYNPKERRQKADENRGDHARRYVAGKDARGGNRGAYRELLCPVPFIQELGNYVQAELIRPVGIGTRTHLIFRQEKHLPFAALDIRNIKKLLLAF